MRGFSNVKNIVAFLGRSFLRSYIQRKIELRIPSRGIFPNHTQDQSYVPNFYAHAPRAIQPRIRFIAEKDFPFESELTIYANNKISIVNVHDDKLVGIIIEDKMMRDMLCMIFELAWKGAVKN